MCGRVHVRIDAQRNARRSLQQRGAGRQTVQFRGTFNIETVDTDLQRQIHFFRRLPNPGEDHCARVATGRHHPHQFPC